MVELDDLVFLEHIVNSLNFPIILIQLMSILFPKQSKVVMGSKEFCFIYFILYTFLSTYRAIGGLGIAGVRVLCISFHNVLRGIGAKRLVDCTGLGMVLLSVIFAFGGSLEVFAYDPQMLICSTLGYQIFGSNIEAFEKEGVFIKYFAIFCFLCNITELICHFILFFGNEKTT